MFRGCPLDRWTGQNSGTSLVSESGMSSGCSMNVHWTGRTIPSGQRILMANLDMSAKIDSSTSHHKAEHTSVLQLISGVFFDQYVTGKVKVVMVE